MKRTVTVSTAALLSVSLLMCSGCGGTAPSQAGVGSVVGRWTLRQVDSDPVGEITISVEFLPDGTYEVVGLCHHARGRYIRTDRGARLQPVELVEEFNCSEIGRTVTTRARAAVRDSAHAGMRDGDLVFLDRAGAIRIRLERAPSHPHADGPVDT